MTGSSYDGPPLDGFVQYLSEAPYWQHADQHENDVDESTSDGETVYCTPPEPPGEETVEDVPVPDGGQKPSEQTGQSTLSDWEEWSS